MTLHRRDRKVIEAPEGIGQVLKEGKVVARVSYTLFVEVEEMYAKSFGIPRETRIDRKSVTGKISVLDGEMMVEDNPAAPSGPFTLIMQDGREVSFYVDTRAVKSNLMRREYQILGTGNKL